MEDLKKLEKAMSLVSEVVKTSETINRIAVKVTFVKPKPDKASSKK